jgi:Heparinase II/III-like protein/Heparinase II/III N-terminus
MSPLETAMHARKKLRQLADSRGSRDWSAIPLECPYAFLRLPKPEDAPAVLREALRRDVDRILSGRWRAFGHLELQVEDPPRWHKDYLVARDLATTACASTLDHRDLPDGADIKLVWELSRWHQLVRLALAAYTLNDERAARKCLDWLDDWLKHNPPYRGWNWTSALEAGIRLIQFTWIDALLGAHAASPDRTSGGNVSGRVTALRQHILPAHVWFTWRHRSFGSSANNHLIGELAGLILATVRWPGLARCGASLDHLQRCWEREVLAQFAEDGGNREQALNYQLFSWELCWQARAALRADGRRISPAVDERLRRAAQFYVETQVPTDPWDYGDSDGAFVTPLFAQETGAIQEWHQWLAAPAGSASLNFWWDRERATFGPFPVPSTASLPGLTYYRQSGQGIWRCGAWLARLDVSPLGYLTTAAHGHVDALQLSLWHRGVAMIVDPGTGSYYEDTRLRGWLASRLAHNAPCPEDEEWPRRLGPFLWATNHAPPDLRVEADQANAAFSLRRHIVERTFRPLGDAAGLQIEDRCLWNDARAQGREDCSFSVRWQFGAGATLERVAERRFLVTRRGVSIEVDVGQEWSEVHAVAEKDIRLPVSAAAGELEATFAGTVSSAFRKLEWAPLLKLVARPQPGRAGMFRTTFQATTRS